MIEVLQDVKYAVRPRSVVAVLCAVLLHTGTARSSEWPGWAGPNHDLTAAAEGLFADGRRRLEKVWSQPLGSGYAGLSVAGGRLTTAFSDGTHDVVAAFDADSGDPLWRYEIAATYRGHDGSNDGPLSTPWIDASSRRVYGLGPRGHLFGLSLEDGRELWRHDLVDGLGSVAPPFGYSTNPVLAGGVLVVQVGAPDGRSIAGFDPSDGRLLWSTGQDLVDHQSPLILEVGGEEQVVVLTNRQLLGLVPRTGEVLWRLDAEKVDNEAFSHPVAVGGGRFLVTTMPEAILYQVEPDDGAFRVAELWRSNAFKRAFSIPVPAEGYFYGYSAQFLTCVDARTGEKVWASREPGEGYGIVADGHLVVLTRAGDLVLAEVTSDGYREKSRVAALASGDLVKPTVARNRVYVRNFKEVASFRVTPSVRRPGEVGTAIAEAELLGELGELVRRALAAPEDARRELVRRWVESRERFPVIEGDDLVHFVYFDESGEIEDLAIAGNVVRGGSLHYEEQRPMHRIPGTGFFFRSFRLAPASVYNYGFRVKFEERLLDPRNPRRYGSGASEAVTPGYEPTAHLEEPEGPRGTIETFTWKSGILGDEREIQVYLPPGYAGPETSEERYPLLIVNHPRALTSGRVDTVLDHLAGKTVAPLIVAAVPRSAQGWELYGSRTDAYARALAEELVPRLDEAYRTLATPASRGIMGYGSGAFGAVYVALERPDVFRKVAALSLYQRDSTAWEKLRSNVGRVDPEAFTFYLEWSRFDYKADGYKGEQGVDSARTSRELVELLRRHGFKTVTSEVGDGPGWGMWRRRTDRLLETLFPLRNTAATGSRTAWTQWGGGPGRNFHSPSSELATAWPQDGPPVIWERELGEDGQSAILFEAGRLYTMTRRGDEEVVLALDAATGASVWETAYPAPVIDEQDPAFGFGPHSTPAIDGGRIFTVGSTVKLHALDLESGKILWGRDLMAEMGAEISSRSYGASPLVTRDLVIVVVGGKDHGVAAFHQASGEVAWTSRGFYRGFSSPLLATVDGQEQVIVGLGVERAGFDPATGELLWLLELGAEANSMISTQLWREDDNVLFGSSAYGDGSRAIRLSRGEDGKTRVEELWMTRKMRVQHGNMVRLGDYVYGSSGDFGPAFLTAVHLPSGEIAFRQRGFSKATLLAVGGERILILDQDGQLALAEVSPQGLEILASAKVLERTAWTVPTLIGERLYLRNRKTIKALDLGTGP